MKGLILCGGKGSRLRPFTFSRPKHLLPIMNKPVLFYGIDSMIQAGIKEIAVVVPPVYKKVFDEALQKGASWGITITLIEQPEPKGLADAVLVAKDFIQQDDFLLYLGDNVIDGQLGPLIEKFAAEKLDGLVSVCSVDNPEQFGVVQLNGDKIEKVVEKPKNPPSNLAINGVYLFRHSLFEAIAQIAPSARGEYELTDAIQRMIDDHEQMGIFHSPYWWKDTGKPDDMIVCNQYFLDKLNQSVWHGSLSSDSIISGHVVVGENASIINSVIHGPAVIGKNAVIENAHIGPYCSISDNVHINGCELKNSIVMENTALNGIPQRIEDSIIGGRVQITRSAERFNTIKLLVGDYSKLVISE